MSSDRQGYNSHYLDFGRLSARFIGGINFNLPTNERIMHRVLALWRCDEMTRTPRPDERKETAHAANNY